MLLIVYEFLPIDKKNDAEYKIIEDWEIRWKYWLIGDCLSVRIYVFGFKYFLSWELWKLLRRNWVSLRFLRDLLADWAYNEAWIMPSDEGLKIIGYNDLFEGSYPPDKFWIHPSALVCRKTTTIGFNSTIQDFIILEPNNFQPLNRDILHSAL